jgi:hypothetical protein
MLDAHSTELAPLPAGLSEKSLAFWYSLITKAFGGEDWLSYEPETVSLHIEHALDDLARDKLEIVRAVLARPDVLDNASFILHSCDVVNNSVAEFEMVPMPTSLELAWYIVSMQDLAKASKRSYKASRALEAVVGFTLTEEGYSELLDPFMGLSNITLHPGQTTGDTGAKKEALSKYLEHMRSL